MGPFTAQERLAAFLLDLSQRFSAHGYSAREFNLRMSRIEIASFLGLSHETISRAFSALQREGLHIDKRRVRITVLEHFARRFEALLRVD
ncbi:MAG: helix-turn-helix domain-containing protein [Ideonella sp.]|nr:helix-turn-helix domain-containing protein [Ideonella sp.]